MKKPDENNKNDWRSYGDLLLYSPLFKKGLIVITEQQERSKVDCAPSMFKIKERLLEFKTGNFKRTLVGVQRQSLDVMLFLEPSANPHAMVKNCKRREEVYFPFKFAYKNTNWGYYINPWMKEIPVETFKGFQNFVTCGCLFGTSLIATNDEDHSFPLIQHNINFGKIKRIYYSARNNAYEEVLTFEINRLIGFVQRFSSKDRQSIVLYHLPYYDYLLFGIKLFIQNSITVDQLMLLANLIKEKKRVFETKIAEHLSGHNIEIRIQSPFDNLFGKWNDDLDISAILNVLNIPIHGEITETNIVQTCIRKLTAETHDEVQRMVWADYFVATPKKIVDIEALLKLGNTVMLGLASRGNQKEITCSLLPVTEKQIQLMHSKLEVMPEISGEYSKICYLTYLDPVSAFSKESNGNLFYFPCHHETLIDLLIRKNKLEKSYRYIAQSDEPEEALPLAMRPFA